MVTEKMLLGLKQDLTNVRDKIIQCEVIKDELVKKIEEIKTQLKELTGDDTIDGAENKVKELQDEVDDMYKKCKEIYDKWIESGFFKL